MYEREKSSREKWGRRITYSGLIAGVIGLVTNPELLLIGGGLAVSGLIFESTGKKSK